jgi:hypothetical protein
MRAASVGGGGVPLQPPVAAEGAGSAAGRGGTNLGGAGALAGGAAMAQDGMKKDSMAKDSMALHVETSVSGTAEAEFKAQIAEAIRDITKLRSEVHLVAPGTLANDGKVIEDARSYQ